MQALIEDFITTADPVEFAVRRLDFAPDPWQADVLRSQAGKLLMNCCRQSGKSTITSILALHEAMFKADQLILLLSPSLRQSRELFRKVQDFLTVYQVNAESRVRLIEDNKLECQFENDSRIVSLPSKEQTIRGFSAVDLIIIDESSRVEDDVYYSTRPMLAVSGGRIILLSTPFGKRGHFHKEWTNDDFEKYKITADECPRITKEFLEQEKRDLGEFYFQQEYECQFLDIEGMVFRSFTEPELYSDEFVAL